MKIYYASISSLFTLIVAIASNKIGSPTMIHIVKAPTQLICCFQGIRELKQPWYIAWMCLYVCFMHKSELNLTILICCNSRSHDRKRVIIHVSTQLLFLDMPLAKLYQSSFLSAPPDRVQFNLIGLRMRLLNAHSPTWVPYFPGDIQPISFCNTSRFGSLVWPNEDLYSMLD